MAKKRRFGRGPEPNTQRLRRITIFGAGLGTADEKKGIVTMADEAFEGVRVYWSSKKGRMEKLLEQRVKRAKRLVNAYPTVAEFYARTFVENSCRQVITALGEKIQAVPESEETVDLLGLLVALLSHEKAQNAIKKGLKEASGAERAMDRLSVEFSISNAGEVRASVKKRKAKKKKAASSKKSSKKSAESEQTEVADNDTEMDKPLVITTKDGRKVIIYNLVINVNVNSVHQLNLNPQTVQNILEEKLDDIIDNKIQENRL